MFERILSRREWLVSAGAMVGALQANGARADITAAASDEELLQVLADEVEGGVDRRDLRTTELLKEWIARKGRDLPSWTDGVDSFDLGHLGVTPSSEPFSLTANHLARLAELNAFALPKQEQLPRRGPAILFGLRGCEVLSPVGTFAAALRMREVAPDHLSPRCVIGIWRSADGQIAAFPASTVPNAAYMWAQMRLAAERTGDNRNVCNLLPTGLHRYRVDVHNRASLTTAVPGALVQAAPVAIVRSYNDMKFTMGDVVSEPRIVGDNLHPAFMVGRTEPPFFSSAGCQVISGSFVDGRATGMWRRFAQLLGLVDEGGKPFLTSGQSTERDGDEYVYMLLTGREVRLVTTGQDPQLRRLRFGSSGPAAASVRQRLGLGAGSALDGAAMRKYAEWHFQQFPARSNVITSERAAALGASL